jgi:hypothetical protein
MSKVGFTTKAQRGYAATEEKSGRKERKRRKKTLLAEVRL